MPCRRLPQDADAHYALGSLLMDEKKYPEAQQELLMAAKLKPDLAGSLRQSGGGGGANKNYPLAMQALDARAKYLPEIPATYFLRATTFDNLKDIPKAVEYYQQFLAVDAGKMPDQEWQARHRLIALDPNHADKYRVKVKNCMLRPSTMAAVLDYPRSRGWQRAKRGRTEDSGRCRSRRRTGQALPGICAWCELEDC